MHQMTIDPATGLPQGDSPPASTRCGGFVSVRPSSVSRSRLRGSLPSLPGFIGLKAVKQDPARVGGKGMAIAGLVLGVVNLLGQRCLPFVHDRGGFGGLDLDDGR